MSNAIATKDMKNVLLNRAFKSSPDYTAYSQGSIGTGTTAAAETDTGLETVIAGWNSGSDYKSYETSYPSFDEANKKVSTRIFVSSTKANGNTISEYGDFNSDGTPKIGGRFVFTGVTKNSSIQLYITPTYKMI